MEHARKTSSPQPSYPMHDEVVTRADEGTTPLSSAKSTTEPASNPLSAYSITDSRQKTTPSPENTETVESMEIALKMLNSPPVMPSLTGEMKRYSNNVSDIQQAVVSALYAKSIEEVLKNWNKCEITVKVLLAVLDEKQEKADCSAARNALKQWLKSCILLKRTKRGVLRAYPESPAKTHDDFITWCLAVARAASTGTPTIARDASLEYLCYVKALNAGCAEARLFIVRDHLLGELYRDAPSCQRFLPREAETQLKAIAARKERLPKLAGLDETHYEIIYDLVNLIRSDCKARESTRDTLANRWMTCKEYEIQQLAPMLYLQNAYGNLDIQRAQTLLAAISFERNEDINVFPAFNLVYQYWFAEIGIADASNSTGIRHMEALAAEMFPAALYRLIEYGQSHDSEMSTITYLLSLDELHLSDIRKRLKANSLHYYIDIIEHLQYTWHDRQWYFPGILAPSFNSALAYKLYTFWQGFDAKVRELSDRENDLMHAYFRDMETSIIYQGTIDQAIQALGVAYTTHENKANEKHPELPLSNLYLPRGCFTKLRLSIHELENKLPFVDDPHILVFRHFSDFITQGKADDKLLDDAMEQNPVATCYRLLSLNHCTETWGYNKLVAKLLEHTKEGVDLINIWHDDAGFGNFIKQMISTCTLKYPEVYCQLMHSISKWINDKKELKAIYIKIAVRKLMQGNISDAKSMYEKARELTTRGLKISSSNPEIQHLVLRSVMPKYYLDIYEAGFRWKHSCNLSHDFDTFIRTGQQLLINNNDPSVYLAWCYRITPFFLMKWYSNSQSGTDCSPIITAYELQKKISSKISRLNYEMIISTAKRSERFLENLPDDVSQTTVTEKLNGIIAEIRSIAKAVIPRQFSPYQESSARSQWGNHNLSTAEPDNDLSECSLVTDNKYPDPHSPDCFAKEITCFITEHILAPKIRKTRSLQSAMALFNQLNESDAFNSARFTVLLIDTISRMETEFVPGILERLLFFLVRFKNDCERSAKCFSQYILRFNTLVFLRGLNKILYDKKMREDLCVELEALKTSIWVAYPDIPVVTRNADEFFKEEQSIEIFNGRKLAQSIKSVQALLNETTLHDTDDVELMMRYIRIINKREGFEERFKPDKKHKHNEIAKLMHSILTGGLDNYSLELRCDKNKKQSTNGTLIWLAMASGKFDDATLNKIVDAKLKKKSAEYHFLKGLLASESATAVNHITRYFYISCESTQYKVTAPHAFAVLNKLFAINKTGIVPLVIVTDSPSFSYIKAILHWRHPYKVLYDKVGIDKICTVLLKSGREAIPEASCRLLDFILEQESRGQPVSDITVYQCCRFIHARTFIATDEQMLYQGITLYLGKGCVSDKEEGLQRINQALASDSPIPALRMAVLQEQQSFPINILEQDCLKLFAQKADTDQELYRDYKQVIFTEILLTLGESGLDWLIRQLESAPCDDISLSRIAEILQKNLDIWRENGSVSFQQSPLPEEESIATVLSNQPSQSAVKHKLHPVRSRRTKKGKQQEDRQGRKSQSISYPAAGHEKPVTPRQLLEKLIVNNKDKAVSEIPGEEISEVLKLLEQLKQKTTTAIRDLSKNRLANLVRMLPWSATILGEVMAAHLKNMTDPHSRANYARQQIERYERLITEQPAVTGDTETHPQGAMEKTQGRGKLLMQQRVPPGVQELIKNTTQVHQEALLSGNLSKDELSSAVSKYPDLYLHYLKETNKPEINCVKSVWEGLGIKSQTALLIKAGAILVTDQCGKDRDSAIKILNDEKLGNDTRLSLFQSLKEESKGALLMLNEGIPDNLVRAYLERMKKTQPKQRTTQHQIRSINQWQTSLEKRLTDNLIHLMKELPAGAEEPDKMKLREFRKTLKTEMDLKIQSTRESVTSLTTGLARGFKASAILMELKEIARAEAQQEDH